MLKKIVFLMLIVLITSCSRHHYYYGIRSMPRKIILFKNHTIKINKIKNTNTSKILEYETDKFRLYYNANEYVNYMLNKYFKNKWNKYDTALYHKILELKNNLNINDTIKYKPAAVYLNLILSKGRIVIYDKETKTFVSKIYKMYIDAGEKYPDEYDNGKGWEYSISKKGKTIYIEWINPPSF